MAVANEGTSTTFMSTWADYMESLRIRVIVAESEVAKEKENVRRGLEEIRKKNVELKKVKKKFKAMDKDIRRKDALLNQAEQRFNRMDTSLERYFDNCFPHFEQGCWQGNYNYSFPNWSLPPTDNS